MENLATIKLELDINAQNIISQYQVNNRNFEEIIKKSIEKAIDELMTENFEIALKDEIKNQVKNCLFSSYNKWSFVDKIRNAVDEELSSKIQDYAKKIAEKFSKDLDETN